MLSRLTEVLDNHKRLDQLMAILKHHGLNAAFITASLLQILNDQNVQENQDEEEDEDHEKHYDLLIEDLQQFQSHF